MDQMQPKESRPNPAARPSGHNAFPGPSLCPVPLEDRFSPVTNPLEVPGGTRKAPGLGSVPVTLASGVSADVPHGGSEWLWSGGSGSIPGPPVNISRPRPTALGTKPVVGKTTTDRGSVPVCIPGPHCPVSQSQSSSDSSTWSPLNLAQTHPSQPYLSPQCGLPPPPPPAERCPVPPSSLSPNPNHGSRPSKTGSPGSTGENQSQTDKSGEETDAFRVYIVTWNVGSAVPPDDIASLFGPNAGDGSVDMFIIGLQEVNSMINIRLKDALFSDQWSELCMDTLSRFGYVLVASQRMQGVLLLVFSKFLHLPFLQNVQTESTKTGLGGYWGNKGGVSARMTMFGHPVCFLNCHLPAHMRNLEQRVEDFESILQQQQFDGGTATGVLDHDVVFWFGDLNFRIEDYDIHVVKSAIENSKLALLWERDQLNMAKNSESILEGFQEGPLKFPPTYKFDVGTHTYDTSGKKRKPAWTDRILWRLRRTGSPVPSHNAALQRGLTSWLGGATRVTQHTYRSHMGYTVSDHKPVSALFSLHFPFRVDCPLVTFERIEKEWTKVSDASIRFAVAPTFQRSSLDWVALYNVRYGFKHPKDYLTSVFAKGDNATQVTFSEEYLPREAGEYVLGYYSHQMSSIVGVTPPFQIQLPVRSPTTFPASDSSDVSSEDDSTLVLLAPSSRSPSPGTGKHRHRHPRRSRSPAVVSALSSSPLPAMQGLTLHPRPRDHCEASQSHSSHSPKSGTGGAKKERLVTSPADGLSSPPGLPVGGVSPLSPAASPGSGVTAPEALIAAILGEHSRPAPISPTGPMGRAGETGL